MTDVGNGIVSATIGSAGAWLSLGAAHPRHGFVELTGLPPFDPAWRGDPAAVRRYRSLMADDGSAFLRVEAGDHEIATRALPGEPRIEQRHRLAAPRRAVVRFRGRLDAHPLPMITEVAPPEAPPASADLQAEGDRLAIDSPELPARADISVSVAGAASSGWTVDGEEARLVATPGDGSPVELVVTCTLGGGRPRPWRLGPGRAPAVPERWREPLARIAERTRSYVLGCTALRVGDGEVCLLTDHRILPLSWTRDAYWQAALLLAGPAPALDVVAAHLRWLWERCQRPGGLWMRSHRPNGAVKDPVLQADQALYPLLELLDYADVAGELPRPADRWPGRVAELWAALPVGEEGLIRSDENAADDRAELPFPLSSQILYWHAATRLAGRDLGLDADFAAAARATAAAVERHFEVDGPLGRQWAYEADTRGGHRLYHDANDLPTALAPLLGFRPASDPVWSTTMRFALGPHNQGWNAGPWGGLGSLHTAGTWTLGDLQEWVAMDLLGDRARSERALERLVAIAGPDGLLPEAYDPATGGAPVRRWFAWPGAALGALIALEAPR